jgi:hypothetical protein
MALTRRPRSADQAPLTKGVFAFNVIASVACGCRVRENWSGGARYARMAASSRIDERWIGALVLAPALLDGWRYHHPNAKWAAWSSRGVKIGMVFMVVR